MARLRALPSFFFRCLLAGCDSPCGVITRLKVAVSERERGVLDSFVSVTDSCRPSEHGSRVSRTPLGRGALIKVRRQWPGGWQSVECALGSSGSNWGKGKLASLKRALMRGDI